MKNRYAILALAFVLGTGCTNDDGGGPGPSGTGGATGNHTDTATASQTTSTANKSATATSSKTATASSTASTSTSSGGSTGGSAGGGTGGTATTKSDTASGTGTGSAVNTFGGIKTSTDTNAGAGVSCGTGVPVTATATSTTPCTDVAPSADYTCPQQAGWGKCGETWMANKCDASCGRCSLPPPPFPKCQNCRPKFASGVNMAWVNFSADVPNPDLPIWSTVDKNVGAAGGRVIRWWLHVNGANTPGYDSSGKAKPITNAIIADMIRLLNTAEDSGVAIDISLWSFDMLQKGEYHQNGEASDLANNKLLLTDDTYRQAYIDNFLRPLVKAIKGHPALYSWEIFNEPEGMSNEFGWTGDNIPMSTIQKTVNWFAAVIHEEAPGALVTNGAVAFQGCSTAGSFKNYYSDSNLKEAGGRDKGTLDFYEVHYYAANQHEAQSPFVHPASYWNLDKPVVIGEFWADDTDGVKKDDLFTNLFTNGYAGAWAWQYYNKDSVNGQTRDYTWPAMKNGLTALYSAHSADIELVCK